MHRMLRFIGLAAIIAAATSCGDAVRTGSGAAFLVIDSLVGAPGNKPSSLGSPVESDVLTLVISGGICSQTNPCPTIFNDIGEVKLRLVPRDIGTPTAPTALTTNNEITITRFHVDYIRADGRNTQGVDVPYSFDGAATGTVPASGGDLTMGFELVRSVAKQEAPLIGLVNNFTVITTLAKVTFYGQDRVGNQASVTGQIQVDFANFGDQ